MMCKSCGFDYPRDEFNKDIKKNATCRTCRSHSDRLRRFNLTEVGYNGMLEAQGGVCAICKQEETTEVGIRPISLSVDHDHSCCPGDKSCGKCVRALLCKRCNKAIGMFEDDAELLKSAIQYLEEFSVHSSSIGGRSARRFGYIIDKVRRTFNKG